MTNEDALRLIKATEYSFVVWSTSTNEVVGVKPLRRDLSFDERHDALVALSNQCSGPTQGRFLDPTSVSMNTLREVQADIAFAAERVRMLWAWRSCSTDDLLIVLETGVLPSRMDTHDDAGLLIDEIYYARAAGLSSEQLARLDAVAAQAFFSPLGSIAAYKLECGLAVIQKDRKRLERFWRLRLAKKRPGVFSAYFAIAAGDLALDLDDVIDHFVAVVEQPGLFDRRFQAMLALGKIGAAAGERAARAIAVHIHDSSESVSQLRDRVLSRIRTPSGGWMSCTSCVRGMVPADDIPLFTACPRCLGVGHVQSDAAQPAVAADSASLRR